MDIDDGDSIPEQLEWPKFGTFDGTTRLYVRESLQQELDISFDLRIEPRSAHGTVDCVIWVDNCVTMASCMFSDPLVDDIGTLPGRLPPYYVAERISITFSPTGKCCVPRNCYPLHTDFVQKQTISKTTQVDAGIEISLTPKALVTGTVGKGKSIDQIPASMSIIPRHIGPADRRAFLWDYQLTAATETHLELSSTHPPNHKATYPVQRNSDELKNFRIKIDVIYRKRGIASRIQSALPASLRFLSDIGWQHIVTTLEAVVEKEDSDFFQFPGKNKKGSTLELDLKFTGGSLGQGQLTKLTEGNVTTRLNNMSIRKP
jgi:hypothetical protein